MVTEKENAQTSRTLQSLIDEFRMNGNNTALLQFTKDGSFELTYRALFTKIRHLSAGLIKAGIHKGQNVIIYAPNSAAWVIACLSVIYSGGIVVPVDSQQSEEALKHIVSDSAAQWIFTDEKGAKRLHKLLPKSDIKLFRLDQEEGVHSWKRLLVEDTVKKSMIESEDIAILFYTSGTTGEPKGVPLNHANILMQLDSVIAELGLLKPTDRVLLPLPLFHVYPLNIGLLGPLRMGLPIIFPMSITGPEIMRALNHGQATVLIAVPRLLRSLYQSIETKFDASKFTSLAFKFLTGLCVCTDKLCGLRPGKFLFFPVHKNFGPSLRLLTSGGAPLEEELSGKLSALGWDIAVGYGLTETAPLLSLRPPADRDWKSAGQPIPNVQIKIVKTKDAAKNEGEILAKGPNIFSGYRNLKEKTEEVFTDGGWFKTGDLGYLKNGHLYVTGRAYSTIVMEGGEKIQPDNIEDKLAKQSGIREIGLLQDDSHKLVALVVSDSNNGSQSKEQVAITLKKASAGAASYLQITDFALTKEPLPRTNLGKIKRAELKNRYEEAKAAEQGEKSGTKKQSTELSADDKSLLDEPAANQCWEWLKSRFPDQAINFDTSPQMDLNIDSLEWVNLSMDLVEQTGVELSQETIAGANTIRDLLNELSRVAQEGGGSGSSPIEEPELYLDKKQQGWLKPLSDWQSRSARFLYLMIVTLMRVFRVTTVGLKNLPHVPLVFIPNHASFLDPFALVAAIPYKRLQKTQWAGWTGIAFGNPLFSFCSRLGQVIPIDAKNSLITSLALAAAVIKKGNNLIWFPEGRRTLTDDLLDFKQGIGILLEKSSVLVVPVYLDGTRRALPPGVSWPRFTKITVIFGEPVEPAQLLKEGKGKTPAEKITNALHERVEKLSENLPTKKPPQAKSDLIATKN